jgi:hypothetical protein
MPTKCKTKNDYPSDNAALDRLMLDNLKLIMDKFVSSKTPEMEKLLQESAVELIEACKITDNARKVQAWETIKAKLPKDLCGCQ